MCICISSLQTKRYCAYLLLLCPSLFAALSKQSTKEAAERNQSDSKKPAAAAAAVAVALAVAAVNNENY